MTLTRQLVAAPRRDLGSGRRKAARRSTRTGAASTSRSRWTSTTARSAARSALQPDVRRERSAAPIDPSIGGPDGNGVPDDHDDRRRSEQLIGSSGVLVAPGIKAQYMDEVIAGVEYAAPGRPQVGVVVPEPPARPRDRGRVDRRRADTYIIANPGEWSDERGAEARSSAIARDRPTRPNASGSSTQLQLFQGIRMFDKPRRDYNALELTLTRRFSKGLYLQALVHVLAHRGQLPGPRLVRQRPDRSEHLVAVRPDRAARRTASARCRRIARTTSSSTATTRSTSSRPAS